MCVFDNSRNKRGDVEPDEGALGLLRGERAQLRAVAPAGERAQLPAEASSAAAQLQAPVDWIPCAASSIAMFIICMDTLITNVALPTIEKELGGGMAAQQWIVDGYTLPFAALLLLAGNLSDRFGSRRVFILGTAAFGLSSLFCALANSAGMLIVGRVLLGISAAFILPSSMAVINEAYRDDRHRRRALAFWGIGGSVASAAGPLLGGILTPIHWSLVFSVNIPFCAAIVLMHSHMPVSKLVKKPFDLVGQALSIAGLTCLVDGIIEAGGEGLANPRALWMLAAGVVLLVAFVVSQARVASPMMPLSLLSPQGMRMALIGGFVMIFNWNGAIFMITLFLQQVAGLSPFVSGLAFMPSAVTGAMGNILSDRLTGSIGVKRALIAGILLITCGYGFLFAFAGGLSAWAAAIAICFAGIGGGTATPLLTGLVLKSAPREQAGIASAMFNTFRQVGGAIGIALFGALGGSLPSFVLGFRASFAVAVVLMACMFAMATRLPRRGERFAA